MKNACSHQELLRYLRADCANGDVNGIPNSTLSLHRSSKHLTFSQFLPTGIESLIANETATS